MGLLWTRVKDACGWNKLFRAEIPMEDIAGREAAEASTMAKKLH